LKAIYFDRYGSADVLSLQEVPAPTPKPNEALVRVHASSVNAADWHLMRADPFPARFAFGLFKPKLHVLGADIAGRIEAIGSAVGAFKVGDEVFADLSAGGFGGFAEYVCVPESALVRKPAQLSFEDAAAVPLAGITALQALRDGASLQAGESVLIHGAAGGVGTFAVQIARALGGRVTAVCSSRNVEQARSLGAERVIDYTRESVFERDQQYDVILAANGYQPLSAYRDALNRGGRYVMVGGTNRQMLEVALLGPIYSLMRGQRFKLVIAEPTQHDLQFLATLIKAGKLRSVVERRFALAEVPDAIRYVEAGHARGKVVIDVAS
jgi:NADPH:quinone reductase-like Zn-dependent oxidoreductase